MPLLALLLFLLVLPAAATELSVNLGGGPQPGADQSNWGGGAQASPSTPWFSGWTATPKRSRGRSASSCAVTVMASYCAVARPKL